MPKPLPALPIQRRGFRISVMPVGIALAASIAVVSGIFLFLQSQTLLQKSRVPEIDSDRIPPPAAKANPAVEQIVALQKSSGPGLLTDEVQQSAMAPQKMASVALQQENEKEEQLASAVTPRSFIIKARSNRASLRSGPGLEYPVIAIANPEIRYVVSEWRDPWLKILLHGAPQSTGWVRHDLVQVLSESPYVGIAAPNVKPLHP